MDSIKSDVIFLNKNNILEFLNDRGFGSVQVAFEDDEAQNILEHGIEICNKIVKGSVYYKQDVLETPNDVYDEKRKSYKTTWTTQIVPDRFRVYFTREYFKNIIKVDDFNLNKLAMSCHLSQSDTSIYISDKMLLQAKKIAKTFDLKVVEKQGVLFLSPKKKEIVKPIKTESVYEKIKKACESNIEKIDFDSSQTSLNTIRAYCSSIKKITGKEITCKIEPGKIVVYFGEKLISELRSNLEALAKYATKDEVLQIVEMVFMPEWQKRGFESLESYNEYLSDEIIIPDEELERIKLRDSEFEPEFEPEFDDSDNEF